MSVQGAVNLRAVARPGRVTRAWRERAPMRTIRCDAGSDSRMHFLPLLLACALVGALVAGCDLPFTAGHQSRATPTPNIAPPLTLDVTPLTSCAANDVCDIPYHSCDTDARWSPDGAHVALLHNCRIGGGRYMRSGLLLVNPLTGARTERISLDHMIMQEAHIPTKCTTPYGSYEQSPTAYPQRIVWTPDSKQLVIPFGYWNYTPLEQKVDCRRESAGVVVLDTSGKLVKFLLREKHSAFESLRWNVQTGEVADLDTLPSALAYRWGSGGELTPIAPLSTVTPAHASSPDPIGDPAGDSTFSMWQPATIFLSRPPTHAPTGSGAYTLSTEFSALSPDGRYLIPDLYLYARFEPDGRPPLTAADLAELVGSDVLVIPMRDAALHQALLDIPMSATGTESNRYSRASIAWRPDGRLLAMSAPYCVLVCTQGPGVATHTPEPGNPTGAGDYARRFIRLYQRDSGQVALDLTPRNGEADGSLSWSPDRTRLLLLRTADALIWNVGALQ
jgi:hypothetical protein